MIKRTDSERALGEHDMLHQSLRKHKKNDSASQENLGQRVRLIFGEPNMKLLLSVTMGKDDRLRVLKRFYIPIKRECPFKGRQGETLWNC